MVLRRPSLGWAKAKLPARAKPASAQIADRITAPPRVWARHSVHSSKHAIGARPAERSDASLSFQIGRSRAHEHVDALHPLAVLRARDVRPRRRRSAEHRDELAALHSITSSARASRFGGTSMPSARAVDRLMTSSNLVGCMTGKSAGLAPLRILST